MNWKADEEGVIYSEIQGENGRVRSVVARVYTGSDKDAKLIASSKDMLKALEWLRDAITRNSQMTQIQDYRKAFVAQTLLINRTIEKATK